MVPMVDRVVSRGRASFAANGLVFVLVLASFVAGPSEPEPAARDLEVRLPGVVDQVELVPHDPRTPELAQAAPEAADSLFLGHLKERGWRLHLVWTEEVALGVLDLPTGATWVTVESDRIVPFVPVASKQQPMDLSPPLVAPQDDASPGMPSMEVSDTKDGVLQIALDADSTFYERLQETWREVQLMVIHLVDGVYQANLGISIEVVSQNVWTQEGSEPFLTSGSCFDVLPSFRSYWEDESPTTQDEREAMHLFVGEEFSGTTIGCAYIRQLETSRAYGVSQMTGPIGRIFLDLHRNVALVSHEIGHNFNGVHHLALGVSCYGATIMYDTLCANSPVFSGAESLAFCKVGVNTGCGLIQGNAHRMWAYGSQQV